MHGAMTHTAAATHCHSRNNRYDKNEFANHGSQYHLMTTYTHSYVDHRANLHNWPKPRPATSLGMNEDVATGAGAAPASPRPNTAI